MFPLRDTRTTVAEGMSVLDDEEVDPKMAALGEPIIGVERVVYDDATGSGAIPARPLPTPKSLSVSQKETAI